MNMTKYYGVSNNARIILITMMMRSIVITGAASAVKADNTDMQEEGPNENGRNDDCNYTDDTSHSNDKNGDNTGNIMAMMIIHSSQNDRLNVL